MRKKKKKWNGRNSSPSSNFFFSHNVSKKWSASCTQKLAVEKLKVKDIKNTQKIQRQT